MNSPVGLLDPINNSFMYSTNKIDNLTPSRFKQPSVAPKIEQIFQSRSEYRRKNGDQPIPTYMPRPKGRQTAQAFEVIGATAATTSAAAGIFPALAPVAAGLGVGYGIYKLGQSFQLW